MYGYSDSYVNWCVNDSIDLQKQSHVFICFIQTNIPDSGGGHHHAIVPCENYCALNIVHLFVESLINNENPVIQIIPPPSLSCGINFGALSDAERLLTWAQANKYKSI